MSQEQRAPFHERARAEKTSSGNKYSGKQTTHGIPISAIEESLQKAHAEKERKTERIRSLVKCMSIDELIKHEINLIFGNYFYKIREDFIPAELSLTKFTIQNGIESRFQTLIDPMEIYSGFRYEAKAHADSTHKLPLPPDALGIRSFKKIYDTIRKSLPGRDFDGGKTMVFTCFNDLKDDDETIEVITSILKQLSDGRDDIEVYSLSELFYEIHSKLSAANLCKSIPNVNVARSMLRNNRLYLSAGYACIYHEKNDVHEYCALAQGTAVVFLLAFALCKPLNIERIEGKHMPECERDAPLTSALSMLSITSETDCSTESSSDSESATDFESDAEVSIYRIQIFGGS